MKSRKSALAFSVAIAALFLSAVIVQPLSLVKSAKAQIQVAQPVELSETRGEGIRIPIISREEESITTASRGRVL